MVRITESYGLNNPLQEVFPKPILASRNPTANDTGYEIGQIWINKNNSQIYGLANVAAAAATWSILGPGSSDVDTLTGDTGGAISPTAGNINILGGDGITVAGAGSTLTVNRDAEGGYPITPYVVGSSGQAGYTTIQAGINAANAAGGGLVFIQPGTYTEDLTLFDGIALFGSSEQDTIIVGTHTPPTSGTLNVFRCTLQDATAIFSSAAAGTTSIICEDCTFAVTNGYTFDLLNWTGEIQLFDIGPGGTNDGGINNTGGAPFAMFAAGLGNGTGNSMILSGPIFVLTSTFGCPIDFQTGATGSFNTTEFNGALTFSNNSAISISGSTISSGATAALTMSSSGSCSLLNCGISSTNTPAIAGAGAGTLTLTGVEFTQDATLAATLTIVGGSSQSGSFQTLDLGAGLTISSNKIEADGTDANISLTATPKGTGTFEIDNGSLALSGAASQLQVEGGAVTDFVGQATLVAGTVTVANTNIAATDRILLTRASLNSSTALGELTITAQTASTSFVITAIDPADGSTTITGDVSIVNYFIVRQL